MENTASQIEDLINKAQLLGILPGPQKYYVQFLTANSGVVGSLSDLIQKIENGTATRNDYIDLAKDIVNIGTATVGMVNPAAGLVLGGIGIAMSVLDYADSKDYDVGVMYDETIGAMIDYAKHNNVDDILDDINELFNNSINSITNTQSSAINKDNILNIEYNLNNFYTDGLIDNTVYQNISKNFSNYYLQSLPSYTPYTDSYFTPIDIGAFYESTTQTEDNSTTIADKTFVLLNSQNQAISKEQLQTLDVNQDGKLDENEITTLKTWKDLNEDGIAQAVSFIKFKNTIRFYQANSKKVA